MLQIRELTTKEIQTFYHDRMKHDFPSNERKPLAMMLSLVKKGMYHGIGLWEEGRLLAYAFLASADAGGWLLLDYFAVREDLRGSGFGSSFLRLVQERYRYTAGILVEAESIRSAKRQSEREVREKRIRFYRRNSMEPAGFYCFLFGVEYEILFLPCDGYRTALPPIEGLLGIYRKIVPAVLYKKNILLIPRERES